MPDIIKKDIQKQPNSKVKINFIVPFAEFKKFIDKADK